MRFNQNRRAASALDVGWLLVALFLVAGCDDDKKGAQDSGVDGGEDAGEVDVKDDAGPEGDSGAGGTGETGDDCGGPEDCLPTLDCVDGVCQMAGCTTGTEGCACAEGDLCGTDSNGDELSCVDGICMSPDCAAAGDTGCPCINNFECNAAEDVCKDGFCMPGDCVAGEEDCECLAGSCDPGLFCKDGLICVDGTGYEGGPCLPDGTCFLGNFCDELLGICVHCELGSEGCQCTENGGCASGLACYEGYCEGLGDLPPDNPVCYTPCQRDLETESGILECDPDGLLPGCIDDLTCVEGSCVEEGEAKPTCGGEVDCPFFQTCLMGGCYSNCEVDSDCHGGKGCYRKVCRTPCVAASAGETCGASSYCETEDGENGFCVALKPAPPEVADGGVPPGSGLVVSPEGFEFSNIKTSGVFEVKGDGLWPQDVTVRKLSHTLTTADGTTETVEAEVSSSGELEECNASAGECPLWWLTIADGSDSTKDQQLSFKLTPDCGDSCPQVTLGNAGDVDAVKWEGVVEIVAAGMAPVRMYLFYTELPDGQWSGEMHYYGNFSENGIPEWLGSGDSSQIDNGLLKRWLAFRDGKVTGGWHEMKAILQATENASWKFGEVARRCAEDAKLPDGACYPYVNTLGIKAYVQNLSNSSIPTGAIGFPIAFNLRGDSADETRLLGRIETSMAMHYPANPAIDVEFEAEPTAQDSCDSRVSTDCVVGLTNMHSEIVVGGRFVKTTEPECGDGYELKSVPWMVPGFTAFTYVNEVTGYRERSICRDDEVPYDVSTDASLKELNLELAESNPVPDGTQRRRTLELLDGALINQSELFILFRESFESFVMYEDEPEVTTAYGYMLMKKQPADLGDDDENGNGIADCFEGSTPPPPSTKGGDKLGFSCDQQLLDDTKLAAVDTALDGFTDQQLRDLVTTLISGNQPAQGLTGLESNRMDPGVVVHYLCEDTGLFNGGPEDDGDGALIGENDEIPDGGIVDVAIQCPPGSKVTYFVMTDPPSKDHADLAEDPCQQDGSCMEKLELWRDNLIVEEWEPFWKCDLDEKVYCDENRLDLRADKLFYRLDEPSTDRLFLPLEPAIDDAFRYKTRFKARSGAQVGFAPEMCIPNSDEIPYCYDPPAIEEARSRVDCLLAIYSMEDYVTVFEGESEKTILEAFLRGGYSQFKVYDIPGDGPPYEVKEYRDGFERLYAELLVMQGDEALTQAFASRFDLAGSGGASFEGSKLEAGGIDLSGVAGFEMHRLYRAVQYYQMALDRLYRAGPNMSVALERHHPSKPGGSGTDTGANFISPETVVLYFNRMIGASTQKARAWSEIAKRYQNFNRADLARKVIERAYTATYLEGAILSKLMWDIDAQSVNSKRDQIEKEIEEGQLRYRMAMLKMQDLYQSITDEVNYFGLAPDYVPFPALEADASLSINGFDILLDAAQNKTSLARQREDLAISSNRAYNTDAAAFQAELTSIRINYEERLSALCGTFEGYDGKIYPAITKYADLDDWAVLWGDPCGRMGNGAIHKIMGIYEDSLYAQQEVMLEMEQTLKKMDILRETAEDQCAITTAKSNLKVKYADKIFSIEKTKEMTSAWIKFGTKMVVAGIKAIAEAACIGDGCKGPAGAAMMFIFRGMDAGMQVQFKKMELDTKETIVGIQKERITELAGVECQAFDVDLVANLKKMWLQLEKLNLKGVRAAHQSELVLSELDRYNKEARRVQAQQEATEGHLINLEAARNDPNVRIYRNDAIINADISFDDAMRAAYRATKVYEYYTSQTYAYKDSLFLIRMIGAGEYNLENYLVELENAFYEFEESYGNPDLRVEVLSLRDDILSIPRLDDLGGAMSQADRIDLMRSELADVDLLDSAGRINISFSTSLDAVSPLTRNHKIQFIEADVVGSDVGDTVGRVTMRQVGTGVVHNVYDETDFYVFPERTTVIDAFFNGNRIFDEDVYRNVRLRDRPLVNTAWQLIIDQRKEEANKDINVQSLSDVRIYLYYSDFTAL